MWRFKKNIRIWQEIVRFPSLSFYVEENFFPVNYEATFDNHKKDTKDDDDDDFHSYIRHHNEDCRGATVLFFRFFHDVRRIHI
jgi:hypothetical protein